MSENKGQKKSSLNQEAGINAIGAKQPRVDLVKCKASTVFGQEVSANVGLNVDTGVEVRPILIPLPLQLPDLVEALEEPLE